MNKVYVVSVLNVNTEELETETDLGINCVVTDEKKAREIFEDLYNETTDMYEENDFAYSNEEFEFSNGYGVTIYREDMEEQITIKVDIMEVE